jgi:hypothetical protein
MNLFNELFVECESLLEDLEEGTVTEVERNSSIDGQIFPLVYIGHLQDDLFDSIKCDQGVL